MREHEAEHEQGTDAERSAAVAAAAAPAEIVLSLQSSLGNRAVSRLLARQEEHSGPRRIDREDPLIETVLGPTLGEHGTYRWLVRYQLPLAAESDGWLIQELYQDSHDGSLDHFWECWRIRRDRHYPEDPTLEAGVLYDDRYVMGRGGGTPDTTGWHRHVGVIRFYPGPLPSEFGRDSGANSYITRREPSSWTGQGTRHDAYSQWDYTGGRRRLNGFVGYAGTTELRRGDRVTFRPRSSAGPTRLEAAPESVPQRL